MKGSWVTLIGVAFALLVDVSGAQTAAPRLRLEQAPAANSLVRGIVDLKVSADPSFQPDGVVYELLVDGGLVSRVMPPAAIRWDTTSASDGLHRLQLVRRIPAVGKTFRETFREEVPVTVANQPSRPSESDSGSIEGYAAMDRHAVSAPPIAEESLDSLASYLVQPAKNDAEKARVLYRWITARVRWAPDTGVNPGQPMDARPPVVLARRTAECLGFAMLFQALARKAGMEVESVHGYVRTDASAVTEYAADPARFNHWWNAVKVDGKWRLIDCGWSVRGEDGTTAGSAQGPVHLEPHYFFCPPEQMIYTHFPLESKWQMVDSPLSLADQKRLPYPRPEFFSLGLAIDSPRTGTIRGSGVFEIKIAAPVDVIMAATISRDGVQTARINANERQGGNYVFQFPRVPPGDYRLTVFAKKRGESGAYREVLAYIAEAR